MNRKRLERVINNMGKSGLKQLLISDPDSIYYLTGIGYDPGERMLALYINDDGDAHLFNNHMFPQKEQEGLVIHLFDDTDDYMSMVAGVLRPGVLGVDKFLRAKYMLPLLSLKQGLEFKLGSESIDDARTYKDAEELKLMRAASALNDRTMEKVIQLLGNGLSERQMVGAVGEEHLQLGADVAYEHLICYGSACSEPHHVSGAAHIKAGEPAIFDIYAPVKHYWCDMTRTVFYKSVSDEQRKIYDIVNTAYEAGLAAAKPGEPLCAVDNAARGIISAAGYGEFFTHRTGHGIGLAAHELPDCSATTQVIMAPGMCFSIEPGIYIPGETGVRIENLVTITETGAEPLNHFTRDLLTVN